MPEAEPLTFNLRADMSLGEDAGAQAVLSYDYDLRNPVPTIGGSLTSSEPIFAGGGFDQVERRGLFGCTSPGMPLTARHDVLNFETAALAEDMVIAGPVTVRLRVSTDVPDTDFTAKLVDVYRPRPTTRGAMR